MKMEEGQEPSSKIAIDNGHQWPIDNSMGFSYEVVEMENPAINPERSGDIVEGYRYELTLTNNFGYQIIMELKSQLV